MVAAEPAITARRSVHSRTNHSETNSLPAQITNHSETNSLPTVTVRPTHSQHRSQITVRPTHSQPLVPFFQRCCPSFSSSVPRARAFLAFEVSSLPSSVTGTTIRAVPSCIDLLPPLGVVLSYNSWDFFPLSHDPFLLCITLLSRMRLSPPPSSSSQVLSFFPFSFSLSS